MFDAMNVSATRSTRFSPAGGFAKDVALALVGVFATLAGFGLVSMTQGTPTAQDNARMFDMLKAEGIPDSDLCLQANQTRAAFDKEGDRAAARHWAKTAAEICS